SMATGSPEITSTTVSTSGTLPPVEAARRRALDLFTEVRNTAMAPTWTTGVNVYSPRELYRPDVTGVAYYEFPVRLLQSAPSLQPSVDAIQERAPVFLPRGFIVVSAGCHDFAIPHWNFTGVPPTFALDDEARRSGRPDPVKYFKVGSGAYVGEDSAGNK